ncbi:MAG: 30S ribosomal protein S2, partial [Candidatus Omnitrophica bacterium]|nr:30S ribosomal protein S2 [Candidatus Omnitrophota bacterium]
DYPIPGNDDAIRSVKLICDIVSKAVLEGRSAYQQQHPDQEVIIPEEPETEPAAPEAVVAPSTEAIVEVIEETVVEKLVDREAVKPKAKKGRPRKETKDVI